MKPHKIKVIHIETDLSKLKRIPKSISVNETFEEVIPEVIQFNDMKLQNFIKDKNYEAIIRYKEDLLLRNKKNIKTEKND